VGDYQSTQEALEAARTAFEKIDDVENLAVVTEWLATTYEILGKKKFARRVWDRLGDRILKSPTTLLRRAGDRWYDGALEAALGDYRTSLSLGLPAQRLHEAFNGFGHVLAGLGQGEEAVQALRHCLSLDQGATEISAYALNGLGLALATLGDRDKALASWASSLQSRPENAWVYFYRGQTRLRWNDTAAAADDLEKALSLGEPALSDYYANRAKELLSDLRGDPHEAPGRAT
jgi:tetratricopeptide (TPR) repeat protein